MSYIKLLHKNYMKKLALLFPGQASQYVGMGKSLYEKYDFIKDLFNEANQILNIDIKDLCFNGNLQELTKTENAQPAILLCSVAAYKVYQQQYGVEPAFVAGHSIGEISALTCIGAINFKDALKIVRKRGLFMKDALPENTGTMHAITNLDIETIENVCKKMSSPGNEVVVSNYNANNQYVISGLKENVIAVSNEIKNLGGRSIPLNVSAPFHSPYMESAAELFREELKKYNFNPFHIPVISNIDAQPYCDSSLISEKLVKQLVSSVQWIKTIQYFKEQEIGLAIELGPKEVLKNLSKTIYPGLHIYSYDQTEDINTLNKGFEHFINKCMAIAVCTPNKNWNNDEYNKGVSEPYKKIQQIVETLERDQKPPAVNDAKMALEMLLSVFETKKVTTEEKEMRIKELSNLPVSHFL